jgi:hypothetical protein
MKYAVFFVFLVFFLPILVHSVLNDHSYWDLIALGGCIIFLMLDAVFGWKQWRNKRPKDPKSGKK